ncbi:1-deoxy-D-xylulose-5-phosphate synthase [Kitasatospora sp. DSM 101779]|uniref:1-deoxy-D-xylulose-5-phosphate synthase n=1 Tax=Kitasatospora sp. DSM 101779 TaxID=2853165 RepID=UPI0021D9CD93|nr:1-deoxy-D-xylulose-5-phosphate synthase [Kitasatospora sp. DSM 101779]MCU7822452.1 1-deoxy-D-xylulose-5-phosphate synthase [Kitasatospora sp. DSM 101779]
MALLTRIRGPRDLDRLTPAQLADLAEEIRGFLVEEVSKTGGHLGPNLGVVELTIAMHRVFDSPRDRILFDTGHQSYVHKLLTGRQDFSRLKMKGGLSGYPSRAESEHDVIENSHASTVLGYADGLAKANKIQGHKDRPVVAVIGDGALTGGMAWEALNNIADAKDLPVVIVVNDNERSYSPTIGGLANHLATLRTTQGYERFLSWGKDALQRTPVVGQAMFDTLHGAKKGLKDFIAPQGMFEDLGLKYIGPIDGHDLVALESAFTKARGFGGPVIVHCITEKGRGYHAAENNDEDRFHAVGVIHPDTGLPVKSSGKDWTSVFGEEMVALGRERKDIVAITAAMLHPVGLAPFAKAYPDRIFDVGIAEQHAAVSAAGLATNGLHPVVAVYATFLNRAYDQVLMDVALHKLGVTFVLDRAGVTGTDGASHNGMWDMSILQTVPGLRLAAPRDADQVRAQLREAVEVPDAPTVVRYSKGSVGPAVPAVGKVGGMDVLRESGESGGDRRADVLIVSVGAMAPLCLEAAELLDAQGITSTVVDPRWVKPVDKALPGLAAEHRVVVTVEDNGRVGGVGSAIAQALRDADVDLPLRDFGIPQEFLDHAKREEILAEIGLTAPDVARQVTALVARLDAQPVQA